MCAIAGIMDLPVSQEIKRSMMKTMTHRGPDSNGVRDLSEGCLLHARLSVVDHLGGAQPMSFAWAGDMYTMVYNGELYNTRALRQELEELGHVFQGTGDTEVLLHGYAQWKEEVLHRLNGIFAFAVWEHGRRRLFLARDRMGVKPLFYMERNGGLIFASEIKTILAYPGIKAQIDEEGIGELILLGPGRTPGSGVFRGVRELENGCWGVYEKGQLRMHRYWTLRDREHRESFGETAEQVRFLVTDAIKRQMVADVKIGTFLSGGLDSSIITAVCAGEMEGLPTFSVDYEGSERFFVPNKFQPEADGFYIRRMCEELKTDHSWCVLSPEDLADALEEATWARDLPGMGDVDFSLLAFCRQIRKKVTVALSGECADEIFGGYPWYRDPEVRSLEGFPWAQNTAQRVGLLHPGKLARRGWEFVRQRYEDTCRNSDILPGVTDLERRMKEMMNLNIRWFMQTLLDRKDRMSMASSLEVRVPFCDHRIAEYLYGVPWEMKDHGNREKGLLRAAMKGLLPEEVLYRKKSPYPKTFDPRYEQIMGSRLCAILEDRSAPLWEILRPDAVGEILAGESTWPWYGQLMRRPQLMAYLLQVNWWMERYGVDVVT